MRRYFWARIKPFVLVFIGLETLMRTIFLVKEWSSLDSAVSAVRAMFTGALFDVAALAYYLIPFALYLLILPAKFHGRRFDRLFTAITFFLFTYTMLFTCVSEWFFWDEFTARFNFIAVDYLVYTQEVIGNIRESYPVFPLLALIGVISAIAAWRFYRRPLPIFQPALKQRTVAFAAILAYAALSFFTIKNSIAEFSTNRYATEIAKNGVFELFSAFWHNELPYDQFYATQDQKDLLPLLRSEIAEDKDFTDANITHHVKADGPEKKYNIVLITVESLSADYLGVFGNDKGLTPYLDSLAEKSLFFNRLYATGTRTVYGLSAITLSIPPLPGNSIVRRPENENLFSLGSVLNQKGYVSKFIYGGFGYFDNMNYFFENNGYEIVDRNIMSKEEISFANVWGVADEDIYRRAIKENDATHAEGKPFFNMIMTTSNHRPFTYPDDKIDIKSGTGRLGGVKYTDYAIKQFLEESKKHAWYNNTIFVIVADHTAGASGKGELNPMGYHIPFLVYAPGLIKPQKIDTLASQIDVAPTILGLLNMDYESRFYGKDILRDPPNRALISNYQKLAYLKDDKMVLLKPIRKIHTFHKEGDEYLPAKAEDAVMQAEALSYFQSASNWKTWNAKLDYPTNHVNSGQ